MTTGVFIHTYVIMSVAADIKIFFNIWVIL